MSDVRILIYDNGDPMSLDPLHDYRSEHVPTRGDRITWDGLAMVVNDRVWRVTDKLERVDLFVSLE